MTTSNEVKWRQENKRSSKYYPTGLEAWRYVKYKVENTPKCYIAPSTPGLFSATVRSLDRRRPRSEAASYKQTQSIVTLTPSCAAQLGEHDSRLPFTPAAERGPSGPRSALGVVVKWVIQTRPDKKQGTDWAVEEEASIAFASLPPSIMDVPVIDKDGSLWEREEWRGEKTRDRTNMYSTGFSFSSSQQEKKKKTGA